VRFYYFTRQYNPEDSSEHHVPLFCYSIAFYRHTKKLVENVFLYSSHLNKEICWELGLLSQYSVWLRTRQSGDRDSIPGRGKGVSSSLSARPARGHTQFPVQWVPGVLSPGVKGGRCVTLTTHPHLVPRSRMSRSYTSSPPKRLHGVSWDCFTLLYRKL
jgi:hypothetical protein